MQKTYNKVLVLLDNLQQLYTEIFKTGMMSDSKRRTVITCIYKKGGYGGYHQLATYLVS